MTPVRIDLSRTTTLVVIRGVGDTWPRGDPSMSVEKHDAAVVICTIGLIVGILVLLWHITRPEKGRGKRR